MRPIFARIIYLCDSFTKNIDGGHISANIVNEGNCIPNNPKQQL